MVHIVASDSTGSATVYVLLHVALLNILLAMFNMIPIPPPDGSHIAAHSCILLLHRETDYYPRLDSILVYPHHHKTDLVAYGATKPAEFFAVVTEAFFEKPK
jgi:Mlc titration factor MtfA (ptsG expression regulator)